MHLRPIAMVVILFLFQSCQKPSNEELSFILKGSEIANIGEDIVLQRSGDIFFARLPLDTDLENISITTNADNAVIKGDSVETLLNKPIDFTSPKIISVELSGEDYPLDFTVVLFYDTENPVLFLDVPISQIDDIEKDEYVTGSAMLISEDDDKILTMDMQIRGRGNSTWTAAKKPFQIKLDEKTSMLGMPDDKRWILLAEYFDKSMLRNFTAFKLGEMSRLQWTPQGQFVDFVINGTHQGLYHLTQKVEKSKNRIDISKDGYLLEVDFKERLEEEDVYFETDTILFNIHYPDVAFNDDAYDYISDYVNEAENVLRFGDYQDSLVGYLKYFDMDSFIDWYIISELTKNTDSKFGSSVFLTMERGEKLKMGPIWDFDIAFGNVNYNDNWNPEGFWVKKSVWFKKLMYDDNFKNAVKVRFQYFFEQRHELYDDINAKALSISKSQRLNDDIWHIIGKDIWPNYIIHDTYEEEVAGLINWLEARFQWMNQAY